MVVPGKYDISLKPISNNFCQQEEQIIWKTVSTLLTEIII